MKPSTISVNKKTKTRGRPKQDGPGTLVGVRWSEAELSAIDDYRRGQADLPGRPAAIRRIVAQALATPAKKPRK